MLTWHTVIQAYPNRNNHMQKTMLGSDHIPYISYTDQINIRYDIDVISLKLREQTKLHDHETSDAAYCSV